MASCDAISGRQLCELSLPILVAELSCFFHSVSKTSTFNTTKIILASRGQRYPFHLLGKGVSNSQVHRDN